MLWNHGEAREDLDDLVAEQNAERELHSLKGDLPGEIEGWDERRVPGEEVDGSIDALHQAITDDGRGRIELVDANQRAGREAGDRLDEGCSAADGLRGR